MPPFFIHLKKTNPLIDPFVVPSMIKKGGGGKYKEEKFWGHVIMAKNSRIWHLQQAGHFMGGRNNSKVPIKCLELTFRKVMLLHKHCSSVYACSETSKPIKKYQTVLPTTMWISLGLIHVSLWAHCLDIQVPGGSLSHLLWLIISTN